MRISKLTIFPGLLILFFVVSSSSCEPEEKHPIPEVFLHFTINIDTDPEFFNLSTPGIAVSVDATTLGYFNLGYDNNGVIVYHAGGGEFYAFDRTCPHDLPSSIQVDLDDAFDGMVTCPECESVYVLPSLGAPTLQSVSKWPLKEYHALFNPNTGDLTVTN